MHDDDDVTRRLTALEQAMLQDRRDLNEELRQLREQIEALMRQVRTSLDAIGTPGGKATTTRRGE